LYFDNIKDSLELKKEYRRLAKIYHPDCQGNEKTMKIINEEYASKYTELEQEAYSGDFERFLDKDIKDFLRIIQETLSYTNIDIEIIGSWIWITGNTYPIRKELDCLGLHYAKYKKAWYWHQGNYKKYRHNKDYTMDEIREMHGSTKIKKNKFKSYKLNTAM